ncbi:MAG: glycosyltransferase [Phycisphaerales bacterium]|nr:glycosyltransferase [Phycisphaerales bacterium]
MRVLLLADRDFAYREHAMLRRLQIGLLDEGIVAQQAHAMSTPAGAPGEAPTEVVRFQDAGPSLTLTIRARRLVRELEDRADAPVQDDRLVDVVHAFGSGAWPMARALARETGAALCYEFHALTQVDQIGKAEHAAVRALAPGTAMAWSCADAGLIEAVEAASARAKVRLVPWGVHVPEAPAPERREGEPLALAILADPASPDHPGALLEALAAFDPDALRLPPGARERAEAATLMTKPTAAPGDAPDTVDPWTMLPDRPMLFVDEASRSWLHRAGRLDQLGLRERLTLTPSLEANRSLALRCDALIVPTATGAQHSLVLDAMALGMRVIAARDSACSILRDDETAFLTDVASPNTAAWTAVLNRAFPDEGRGHMPTESARAILRDERLASHQIAELINLYGELGGPPPAIAFEQAAGGIPPANA